MKKAVISVVGLLILMSFGCPVRSIFPLFDEGDKAVVFRPELLGVWISEKEAADPDAGTMTIRRAGVTNGYLIEVPTGREGAEVIITTYHAYLGRIGDAWFLQTRQQIHPDEADHLIEAYMIHRLWLDGDKFRAASLDAEWLEKTSAKKAIDVAHLVRDGELILTAETPALKDLVRRFADDPGAFPEPETYIRKK
jgi:hypothetical protein